MIYRFLESRLGFDPSPSDFGAGRATARTPDVASKRPHLLGRCAATIQEVLTRRNPKDQHGRTSHLTPAQLADLCASARLLLR